MLQKTNRLTGKITENIKTASPVSFVSDITYRGSRIIVDDYASAGEFVDFYGSGVDGSARAGDRAPDAPGLLTESGEVTTLFDSGVFASNAHTVITFAKEPPQKLLPVPNPGLVRVAIIVPQGSASGFIPGGSRPCRFRRLHRETLQSEGTRLEVLSGATRWCDWRAHKGY